MAETERGEEDREEEEEEDDDDDEEDGEEQEENLEGEGGEQYDQEVSSPMSGKGDKDGEEERERGRSRSPRSKKKKSRKTGGSTSPKGKKSKSPKGSKSPKKGRSKSPGGRSAGKGSKSPSRSKSPKSGKKGGKKKKKKKKKKGIKHKRGVGSTPGRQELQAVLDRTVYEARIKELEYLLTKARIQNDVVVKSRDEDNETNDFIGKELQLELESQHNVIEKLVTKAAEDRRSRRKQEQTMKEELQRLNEALQTSQDEARRYREVVEENSKMWDHAKGVLTNHDKLVEENRDLKQRLELKEATLKEYEGRFTILHRTSVKATMLNRSKGGSTQGTIGGSTGLVPVLLEAMKMFPNDKLLQREMCLLCTHIAFTPEDYIIMSEYEGLELILAALHNHRTHKPLVASAMRMLWKFATASQELRDRLRGSGGLALVLNILSIIPQCTARRMEFFAARLISYLMPEEVSTKCPTELLAEEQSALPSHGRRSSDPSVLPFISTKTLSSTSTLSSTVRRKSSSVGQGLHGLKLLDRALPGATGESGELTLSTRDLVKILLTLLTWAVDERVEFDGAEAERLRTPQEAKMRQLESEVDVEEDGRQPAEEDWLPPKENAPQVQLWKVNPQLAKKLTGDALVALVAAIEAKDDGSGSKHLAFSRAALGIIVRAWRTHFDTVDVVTASCLLVRHALVDEPLRRAEQLSFLRMAGLDKVLKASERKHKGESNVTTELVTLSRIFFVEVVF